MPAIFPSVEWLKAVEEKLNEDAHYRNVAKNWEGDLLLVFEPEGNLKGRIYMYFDLWHGKCRRTEMPTDISTLKPVFIATASYGNFTKVLQGELDPMVAMLTNKVKLHGNLGYMMRNVPTVLDFVRCCREITTGIL